MSADPGLVPERKPTAGTLFVALYGALSSQSRPLPVEQDAYQLFYQRSLALGWLEDAGLWSMNDAGWDHPGAMPVDGEGLLSWFQVEAGAVPGHRPLPVQPFLRCVEDVTLRRGAVRLSAVQVLLPVQGLVDPLRSRRAGFASMQTKEWFTGGGHRPAVTVVLDVGQGPALVAAKFADLLESLDQNVFTVQRSEAASPEQICRPLFDDSFWNGPPGNAVVLHGELAEWSCDAIGWLGEIIADIAVQFCVTSPLLYTVRRTTQDTCPRPNVMFDQSAA